MQVASLAELRDALRTAPPGEIVELAPGEYQGPLFIDTSLTLRGLDRRTVLWRRGGPVIYIRSPGVKVEKLLIERTVSPGPLIVHKAGYAPTGKESKTLDALINLGDLLPGSTITLPLELETKARAEIAVSGLYGAHVSPAVFEEPGKHTAWLTLDGNSLQRGEVLLGEIAIREGKSTRYVWLSGSVLEYVPVEGQFCLSYKKTKLYPSARGLMIDNLLLSALGGPSLVPGRYAYVQRDPTGVLFLYIPADPPAPVTVNGNALARWDRVLLHDKDTIKIGSVSLNISPTEALPLRIDPPVLTFPDFSDQFPDPATLTVHNTGKAAWKGHVTAVAPWLGVGPEGDFRMPPGRSNSWTVQLNAESLTLANGPHEQIGGLLIVGANQVVGIDVRLNVQRPDVVLRTWGLDFGAVEWGLAAERVMELSVDNLGRGTWTGNVRSATPWLEVTTPTPITCGPWSENFVQVRFIPNWENLPAGTYDLPAGLVIEGPDREVPAPVRLHVTPPQPHLAVVTPLALFDQVERNAPLPTTTIQVRNDGGAPWTGTIRAVNGWARLSPGEITSENAIAPGETTEFDVHLLDVPAELALDTPVVIDEVRFEAGESTTTAPVSIGVQLTVVELPPFLVANPVNFAPFVKGDPPPEGLLRIHNNGPARWRGTVVANTPWLNVPDSAFTCEPGDSIELYVTLNGTALENLTTGLTHLDNALTITGAREAISAPVQIDLRDPISEIHLETPTLNFGQVDGSELPTQSIRLVNAGPAAGTAKVELCVPWLSIPGSGRAFTMEIPGMTIAEFSVTLNDAARWLPPGPTADDRALLITGREKQMPVQALLMFNESSPLLTINPARLTLSGDGPQIVAVKNTGKRGWTVQIKAVSWLKVTPTELALEADQEGMLEIRGEVNTPPGEIADPRAIVLIGPWREYEVEVKIVDNLKPDDRPNPRLPAP